MKTFASVNKRGRRRATHQLKTAHDDGSFEGLCGTIVDPANPVVCDIVEEGSRICKKCLNPPKPKGERKAARKARRRKKWSSGCIFRSRTGPRIWRSIFAQDRVPVGLMWYEDITKVLDSAWFHDPKHGHRSWQFGGGEGCFVALEDIPEWQPELEKLGYTLEIIPTKRPDKLPFLKLTKLEEVV